MIQALFRYFASVRIKSNYPNNIDRSRIFKYRLLINTANLIVSLFRLGWYLYLTNFHISYGGFGQISSKRSRRDFCGEVLSTWIIFSTHTVITEWITCYKHISERIRLGKMLKKKTRNLIQPVVPFSDFSSSLYPSVSSR